MKQGSIAVLIPYFNGYKYIEQLLSQISPLADVYIADSGEEDGLKSLQPKYSFNYIKINKGEFRHGKTRNKLAEIAIADGAEILVFITQDISVGDICFIPDLIKPILSGEAAATFARQIPHAQAGTLERFSRYFNYPAISENRTSADIQRLGVKAFFFSNVCSAVRSDIFLRVGGFAENVIMNEDMMLAANLLKTGYTVRYVAEAEVEHSHNYSLKQQFQRNFDVGVFFADASSELKGADVRSEGLRFVREQLLYVWRHQQAPLLFMVIIEAITKFTAFQIGKRHRLIPDILKRRLSMHSYHWGQIKENL